MNNISDSVPKVRYSGLSLDQSQLLWTIPIRLISGQTLGFLGVARKLFLVAALKAVKIWHRCIKAGDSVDVRS